MSKPIFPPPLRVICADHSKFYPIHTLNDVMVVSRLLKWQMNHGLLYHINREEMIKTKYSIFHFIIRIILIHIYEMSVLKIIKLFMPLEWKMNLSYELFKNIFHINWSHYHFGNVCLWIRKRKEKWKNSFTNPYLHTQSLAIMIPVISD